MYRLVEKRTNELMIEYIHNKEQKTDKYATKNFCGFHEPFLVMELVKSNNVL